jgi:hypothetical protein
MSASRCEARATDAGGGENGTRRGGVPRPACAGRAKVGINATPHLAEDISLVSWLAQLIAAATIPVSVLLLTVSLQDTLGNQIFEYLLSALIAMVLAFLMQRVFSDSFTEGVLVWILPAAAEIALAVWGLFSDGFLLTFHALVFSPGPGQGVGSAAIVIITHPVWSCCWYSAAMWWRQRAVRRVTDGISSVDS